MAKKLGLCLGSGGTRGIAHVGFLQALVENNIPIDMISGCSMGSLVGALFLSGYTPLEMHDAAISLKKSDIFDITLTPIFSKAIMKSKKFDDILNDFFGNSTFGNLSKPFACISTDLISGKVFCFYDGLVKTAVRASCSIPIGFKPVKYENMLLVDGGISNRTPVAECRALGADVVVAVDVLAELPEMDKITNIFSLGYRALDIMGVNIDMRHDEKQRPDLLLLPELGKTSQYKVENQQFCYDKGYELGINSIDKIKALIS